jgi:hypothetical protein
MLGFCVGAAVVQHRASSSRQCPSWVCGSIDLTQCTPRKRLTTTTLSGSTQKTGSTTLHPSHTYGMRRRLGLSGGLGPLLLALLLARLGTTASLLAE